MNIKVKNFIKTISKIPNGTKCIYLSGIAIGFISNGYMISEYIKLYEREKEEKILK